MEKALIYFPRHSLSLMESDKENTSKPFPSSNESAKENTSKTSPKKVCFADGKNQTSRANSDSYKKYSNAKKSACNEAGSFEEENIGISDNSDEEEIQLPKCGRKGDAENLNEKKGKH